jgi:hypothetical protein
MEDHGMLKRRRWAVISNGMMIGAATSPALFIVQCLLYDLNFRGLEDRLRGLEYSTMSLVAGSVDASQTPDFSRGFWLMNVANMVLFSLVGAVAGSLISVLPSGPRRISKTSNKAGSKTLAMPCEFRKGERILGNRAMVNRRPWSAVRNAQVIGAVLGALTPAAFTLVSPGWGRLGVFILFAIPAWYVDRFLRLIRICDIHSDFLDHGVATCSVMIGVTNAMLGALAGGVITRCVGRFVASIKRLYATNLIDFDEKPSRKRIL